MKEEWKTNLAKVIIEWLCGAWAFGIGIRMIFELLQSDTYICIPKIPLNVYFDFGVLAVLGLIIMIIKTLELIKKIKRTWD